MHWIWTLSRWAWNVDNCTNIFITGWPPRPEAVFRNLYSTCSIIHGFQLMVNHGFDKRFDFCLTVTSLQLHVPSQYSSAIPHHNICTVQYSTVQYRSNAKCNGLNQTFVALFVASVKTPTEHKTDKWIIADKVPLKCAQHQTYMLWHHMCPECRNTYVVDILSTQ